MDNAKTAETYYAPKPRKALTVKEFHQEIGMVIGLNSIYELIHAGRLKSVKIGVKLLIPRSEVDDFFIREAKSN
jgi:excisionase family DNA binding protein